MNDQGEWATDDSARRFDAFKGIMSDGSNVAHPVWETKVMAKKSEGKKVSPRTVALRCDRSRFFCPQMFLPDVRSSMTSLPLNCRYGDAADTFFRVVRVFRGYLFKYHTKKVNHANKRHMLRHFLAALAYRGTNVLQDLPAHIPDCRPSASVRSPVEILNHLNGVLTYAHSFLVDYDSTEPRTVRE